MDLGPVPFDLRQCSTLPCKRMAKEDLVAAGKQRERMRKKVGSQYHTLMAHFVSLGPTF